MNNGNQSCFSCVTRIQAELTTVSLAKSLINQTRQYSHLLSATTTS